MPRTVEPNTTAIHEAAEILRQGGVVAFPTETVYGLGASTFNSDAITKVFELKGRPHDNPLIAHVLDARQAATVASSFDESCDRLATRFWPGPLTLVLPRTAHVPANATGGRNTIAVRSPAHPVARTLLEELEAPISAPSANRSGRVSPTTAGHVASDFSDVDDLMILDGGSCALGIESTVVDVSTTPPCVLRQGAVTIEELREIIGALTVTESTSQLHSPGTALRHYAPVTAVQIVAGQDLRALLESLDTPAAVLCFDPAVVPSAHQAIGMPDDAHHYAAQLYDALRCADELGLSRIVIERPAHDAGLWSAINDRLKRASS